MSCSWITKGDYYFLYTFQKIGLSWVWETKHFMGMVHLEAFGNIWEQNKENVIEKHSMLTLKFNSMLIWKDMFFFSGMVSLEFSLHYQKQNLCHAHLNLAKYVSYPSTVASSLCEICIWKKIQKLSNGHNTLDIQVICKEKLSERIFSYLT